MYLRFFSFNAVFQLFRLTPSHLLLPLSHIPHCCLSFDLLPGELFFFFFSSEVYRWGFGCRSDRGFDAGAEAALSLNPLAGVAGTAAEC